MEMGTHRYRDIQRWGHMEMGTHRYRYRDIERQGHIKMSPVVAGSRFHSMLYSKLTGQTAAGGEPPRHGRG